MWCCGKGQGLGRKPSPISHEVPGTHSQLESSTHSQDQVRSHWLRIAPIMPSGFLSLKSHQTEDWRGWGGHWIRRRRRLCSKTCPSMGPLATCTLPRSTSPLDLVPHSPYPLRSHCQLVFCSIHLFSSRFFLTTALSRPLLQVSFSLRSAISAFLPSNHVFQTLISA